jgi:hypothetical protein
MVVCTMHHLCSLNCQQLTFPKEEKDVIIEIENIQIYEVPCTSQNSHNYSPAKIN